MTDSFAMQRLRQTLDVVSKENRYLQSVRGRLFPPQDILTKEWLNALLSTPEGEDRLESFGAKFARMQDTVIDKLLPKFLYAAGETPGTAIDNLNRVERLGLISKSDDWIMMRRLRNKLVHEYIDDEEDMLPVLMQADKFSDELSSALENILSYVEEKLA